MNPRKAGLALEGLGKRFGDTESVSDVTLRVGPGELMALLGSSGAGKSTILRCIAGHLEPDAGEVWIGGERMDQAPPEKRNVGMVFQSYALFPHLNVRRNVAFGPERRGASRSQATELADEMLDQVGLLELGDRYPRQISGGEQQRVAVARALAIRPEVLLLDEPLSSLDQTLRRELRSLLRRLQQSFGATTVWVTHDQEEALTVADRVAVLDRGRLQQVGTPLELHTRPANTFVASFVGKMNLLPATPEAASGDAFRLADGPVLRVARDALPGPASPGPASPGPASKGSGGADAPFVVAMRPEVVQIGHPPAAPGFNRIGATVRRISFLGDRLEIELELEGRHRLLARGNTLFESLAREGDRVRIYWPVADTRLLIP